MHPRLLSHGRALLVLVPFLTFGCNDSTPPPVTPEPVLPPAAAPVAPPAPEPPEPGPGANVGCNAGPGTFNENCSRLSPAFLGNVDDAINRVVARRPELFNLNDARGQGGFRVLDSDAYYHEVVNELRLAGFCAVADGGEVAVKIDNSMNDQFHIMVSSGHVRRGEASYRATCRPAWF
jgi:hypothetical protein